MLTLLFSLVGLVVGFIVSMFAFEELDDGKKYFYLIKRIILGLIFVCFNYVFFTTGHYIVMFLFTALVAILFTLELRWKNFKLEMFYYILFILAYIQLKMFLVSIGTLQISASLIFLYGVPLGTLIHSVFFGSKKVLKNKF